MQDQGRILIGSAEPDILPAASAPNAQVFQQTAQTQFAIPSATAPSA